MLESAVVLALTAIVAGLAAPTYQAYYERQKVKQAQLQLMELQLLQERFRLANGVYASADELQYPELDDFDVFIEDVSLFTYTLRAEAKQGTEVECASMSVNHAFLRAPAECWD
nr:type IV pilin protein [Alteromonas ponticola]